MKSYHKIKSLFKRDDKTHKFIDEYSLPEFEYLQYNTWIWEEKIDGTNIRIMWDGEKVTFGGKTDNAQIYVKLYDKLIEIFPPTLFTDIFSSTPVCLYGEGFGSRIQKGGGNYIADGVDFILFDILIGHWWLIRKDVKDIAKKLGIKNTPVIGEGTLEESIVATASGFCSTFGKFSAEGLVLRPKFELKTRSGQRIITKIKCRDF